MSAPAPAQALTYAYAPRLGGAGVRLALAPPALDFAVGLRQGRLDLKDVTAVRLVFLPAKLGSRSFEMELSGRDGTRLRTGSASCLSLTGVRDQGAEYAAFVRALHAALAASGARPRLCGGYGPWRFALMAAAGTIACAGLLAVLGLALAERQWSYALFLGAMGAFVIWPAAEMVWRNRPVSYTLKTLPRHLLPA